MSRRAKKMKRIVQLVSNGQIPVLEYGFFDIVASIVEIDYPRCFIAKNGDSYYAFVEIENSNDLFGWNVARVSLQSINSVNSGIKNVQSLFDVEDKFILLFNNSEYGTLKQTNTFNGKYAINGSLFVKNFCDMDADFDFHKFAFDSQRENSLKLSVVLQDEGMCSTGQVLTIVNYLKSLCKNMQNPLNIDCSKFFVKNNSTVITFSFDDSCGPLFDSKDVHSLLFNGINELGNYLASNESSDLISAQDKRNNTVIKKFEKLVESFEKTNDSNPKIVISTPEKDKPVSFIMSKKTIKEKKELAKRALEIVNSKAIKSTEKIEREGLLTGIVTGKGNFFKFEVSSNETFTGSVDFGIIGLNQFDVKGTKYRATIEKTCLFSQKNKLLEQSYKLVNLIPIEKASLLVQTKIEGLGDE